VVEAEDPAGIKLKIHLKGPAMADVASLARMLWGPKP